LHIVLQNENKQVAHENLWLLGCHPEISTGALPLNVCRGGDFCRADLIPSTDSFPDEFSGTSCIVMNNKWTNKFVSFVSLYWLCLLAL